MTGDDRVSFDAPILPFEYPWDGDQIEACLHCLPWRVEIYRKPGDSVLWMTEWHAVGCPSWNDPAFAEDDDD